MRVPRSLRVRGLVALLAAGVALSGTGLPCLVACAARAEESHDHAAPCHGEEAPGACDVLCGSDPAPAIVVAGDDVTPLPSLGIVQPVAIPFRAAPIASRLSHGQLPDRSPPVSTGCVVLRI